MICIKSGGVWVADLPFFELLDLTTLTLATSGPDGEPHGAALYFAADEKLRLYFFSDRSSQHTQDILVDGRAAVTIQPQCHGWEDIRGLQMRGQVHLVNSGDEWERAWEIYVKKFPFVSELQEIVAQNQFYVFLPNWVRLVDNRRGFGYKSEWTLP